MSAETFYRAFEDLHRGSRELIESRLTVYLPFVRAVAQMHPGASVVDLGCGRGEWLGLMRREAIAAQGVDLDVGMLAACRQLGLDVHLGDAITFLAELPDESQCVVTGFHIAEHLPFATLETLIRQALRVLRPGGLLILETPNPENLAVGTSGFYLDPTHQRPLPPLLLEFLPRFHGFSRTTILRLQEGPGLRGHGMVTLLDVVAGVSPDFAVVAQKDVGAQLNGHAGALALDLAFSQQHGVSLNELAERHERQLGSRMHHAQSVAEAARQAALAAQAASARTLDQMAQAEHKLTHLVLTQLTTLQTQLLQSHRQLQDIHQSTSWRLTRPVRWLGSLRLALATRGPGGIARSAALGGARMTMSLLNRHPAARRMAWGSVQAMGLGRPARRLSAWLRRPETSSAPQAPPILTAAAQRTRDRLAWAMTTRSANAANDSSTDGT